MFKSELSLFQNKKPIKVIIILDMTEPLLSVLQIFEKYKMSVVIDYNTVTFVKRLINVSNKSIIDQKTLRNRLYYYKLKIIRINKTNTTKMNV
jgi:hypothetical protein